MENKAAAARLLPNMNIRPRNMTNPPPLITILYENQIRHTTNF